jgi:hypothetical protein
VLAGQLRDLLRCVCRAGLRSHRSLAREPRFGLACNDVDARYTDIQPYFDLFTVSDMMKTLSDGY